MLRFDNNTDSNQHSGAYFYWTVLTAIVSISMRIHDTIDHDTLFVILDN